MFKQRKGVSKSNGRLGARLSQKLMREKRNKGLQKWYWLLILRDRKAAHARIGDTGGEEERKSFPSKHPRLSKPLTHPPACPPGRTGGINRQAKQEKGSACTQTSGRAVTAQKPGWRIREVKALAAKPGSP